VTGLRTVAEELYGLLPSEFTGARNAKAKQLRGTDRELAEAVAGLAKPATSAWVLNMLVRHESDLVGQVVGLGESLRQAQERLSGDALRDLTRQRRQLTAAVTRQARDLARRLGVQVSEPVADQVEESLRAAMTDGTAAAALRTGLLVKPLSSTGLGDLDVASVVAVPEAVGGSGPAESEDKAGRGRPALKVVGRKRSSRDESAARRRALKEAEAAAKRTEKEATRARKALDRAGRRYDELEAQSLQLQSELEEVRRRADELEHALESLDDEISDAEEARDSARHESTRADHVHAEAVAALDRARSAVRDAE